MGGKSNEMKTTAQRLSEVYCRPKKGEWKGLMLVDVPFRNMIAGRRRGELCFLQPPPFAAIMDVNETDFHKGIRTEIHVQHFIDLLNDSIVAWRLEEDTNERGGHESIWRIIYVNQYHIITIEKDLSVRLNGKPTKVKTYTQLLTLIEMI